MNGPAGACAAAAIVYPPSGFTCRPPVGGTYAATTACPLSPPLAQRLDSNPPGGAGGPGDPLCRCQNAYQPPTYTVAVSAGTGQPAGYVVRVGLPFGTSHQVFDVHIEAGPSGPLVDDIRCAGGPASSSIMATPLVSCSS